MSVSRPRTPHQLVSRDHAPGTLRDMLIFGFSLWGPRSEEVSDACRQPDHHRACAGRCGLLRSGDPAMGSTTDPDIRTVSSWGRWPMAVQARRSTPSAWSGVFGGNHLRCPRRRVLWPVRDAGVGGHIRRWHPRRPHRCRGDRGRDHPLRDHRLHRLRRRGRRRGRRHRTPGRVPGCTSAVQRRE